MEESTIYWPAEVSLTQAPVERVRASEAAQRFLRSLVFSGRLAPSEKLPSERELSNALGISRITLREALKCLESAGYLVTTVGAAGGTRVADPESLMHCWGRYWREHSGRLGALLEFQSVTDAAIAWYAAEKRTDEDLAALNSLPSPMDPGVTRVKWHDQFHALLARAARNEYLEKASVDIRSELFLPVDLTQRDARWPEHALLSHYAILSAVTEQDRERAGEEMRRHLDFAHSELRGLVEQL
jgi:GntR family transcriptional regulator, transcriptional repressor for pyruvate dehydrogenase complex